jgi:uncharacterized membrane protein YjjP (DUF1212 family)
MKSNVLKIGLLSIVLCLLFNRLSGSIFNFLSGMFAGIGIICIIATLLQKKNKKSD